MSLLAAFVLYVSSAGFAFFAARSVLERAASVKGQFKPLTLDEVIHDRMLCFAAFAAVAVVVGSAISAWAVPVCVLCAYALSRFAPAYVDKREQSRLRSECDAQLDVLADTLAFAVRAGMNFDAALDLYCTKFDGTLARQMESALAQWRGGLASREQALRGLAQRIGTKALHRFVDTVVQAVEFGSPLAGMLEQFASELRMQRRESVERQVEKAPVKMLVPMGVCILPAMLILVMGPVVLQFSRTGF